MPYPKDKAASSGISKCLNFRDLLKPTPEILKREERAMEKHDKVLRDVIQKSQRAWNTSLSFHDNENATWEALKDKCQYFEQAKLSVQAWNPTCNYGIFLYGKPGNGKTHMLKSLINEHASNDRIFLFRTMSNVMAEIKDFNMREYVHQKLIDPWALILDDFGAEKASEYEQNELFRILEYRMAKGRHVFMTSNLDMPQLQSKYSDRIISRLGQLMAFVHNKSESHRKEIYKVNQADLMSKTNKT